MTARLQAATRSEPPVLLRMEAGGHLQGSLDQTIEESTDLHSLPVRPAGAGLSPGGTPDVASGARARLPRVWSVRSENSLLSICSRDSVLSIGSSQSFASFGSVWSFASAGSIGSAMSAASLLSYQSSGSVLSHQANGSLLSSQADRDVGVGGATARCREESSPPVSWCPRSRCCGMPTDGGAPCTLTVSLSQ